MINRAYFLMLATAISCLSFGCNQTNTTFLSEAENTEHHQTADMKWLKYADPEADANLSIQKQDFKLLAFAGKVTSFPGVGIESSILQKRCGYRLLANSGDALRTKNQLTLRKQLYQYAATFNQLVAAACQKSNLQK